MNSDVTIKVGDYEVFSNGTVIVPNSDKLHFEFMDLKIHFVFETDSDNKFNVVTKLNPDKDLTFRLINFDNSLGIGLNSPIKVGYVNGKDLYILFIVQTIGKNGAKKFSYTWLTKKKGE